MSSPNLSSDQDFVTPDTPKYAGFWRRYKAFAVEGVIQLLLFRLVLPATGLSALPTDGPVGQLGSWGLAGLWLPLYFIYAVVMESGPWQGTVGKRIMGIMVTDLNGQRLSFRRAIWRQVLHVGTIASLGITYLLMVFSPKKQGRHDKLAGSLVIYRPSKEPAPEEPTQGQS